MPDAARVDGRGGSASVAGPGTVDLRRPQVAAGVEPLADDSLMSLLCRTGVRNHLGVTGPLVREGVQAEHGGLRLAARTDLNVEQLAWALRADPEALRSRTYQRVVIRNDLPGVMFHGATIPTCDLALGRRVAPAWLRNGTPRHSAVAHHGLVTHCPASGEMLLDRCPACETRLSWLLTDIAACSACGADLRSHEAPKVDECGRSATRLMIGLVHPDPDLQDEAVRTLPEEIRNLDRGLAFELGWRLGGVAAGLAVKGRDRATRLPVEKRLEVLAAGSTILRQWPHGVIALVSERAGSSRGTNVESTAAGVRSLLSAKVGWPGMREPLLAVAPELGRSLSATVKAALPGAGNAADATRSIGVSQKVFERLRAAERIVPIVTRGTTNKHQIFDPGAIEAAKRALSDRVGVGTVSQRLGISRAGVEQLCGQGTLDMLEDATTRSALIERQVRRTGFDRLVADLEVAAASPPERTTMPLRRALRTIGGWEKPWGALFGLLLDGSIPFSLTERRNLPFSEQVMIAHDDVHRLALIDPEPARSCRVVSETTMKREDVEELLNLDPRIFGEALRAGEIPRLDDGRFERRTMLSFARRHISGGEILLRWMGGGMRMPPPMRAGGAPQRIGFIGWSRPQVEAAMAGHPTFWQT